MSDMEDRNYRRLILSGAIAGRTLFRQMTSIFRGFYNPSVEDIIRIGTNSTEDPLCHFDFSDEDIRSGRKYIEYQILVDDNGDMYFSLYCRDYTSKKGRRYVFSNPDNIYFFATELGIKEAIIRNADGKKVNAVSIKYLDSTVSNLGTMLIIFNAAQDPNFKM